MHPVLIKSRMSDQSQPQILDNKYKCANCQKSYKKKGILKTHSIKKHGTFVDPFPKTPFTAKEKKKRHAKSQYIHDKRSKRKKINMYLGKIKTLVAAIKDVKYYYEDIIRDLVNDGFPVSTNPQKLKSNLEPNESNLYNFEMIDYRRLSGKFLLSREDMLILTKHDEFDSLHPDSMYHV